MNVGDPHMSQTKWQKKDNEKSIKNGRCKSGVEVLLVKGQSCKLCKRHGYNKRSCKLNLTLGSANQEIVNEGSSSISK